MNYSNICMCMCTHVHVLGDGRQPNEMLLLEKGIPRRKHGAWDDVFCFVLLFFETQSELQIHGDQISSHNDLQLDIKIYSGMFLFHAYEFHYHTEFNSVFTVSQVMKVSRGYSASDSSSLESQNAENDLKSFIG